jgi:isocitrate dehydrogenase (NAD+)
MPRQGQADPIQATLISGDGIGSEIVEAVHGSAPDIAGQGLANPTSLLFAARLMFEHVGRRDLAQRLDAAINRDNVHTRDLGGRASTREFAEAVARHV